VGGRHAVTPPAAGLQVMQVLGLSEVKVSISHSEDVAIAQAVAR
jgi:phosphopantetheinyl transferase (holo-ACP synthase)